MEFDKSRVFTAVNADELKQGDKVIVADQLSVLKQRVQEGRDIFALQKINGEDWGRRFGFTTSNHALAYLVERKENCTNCANRGNSYCSCFTRGKFDEELSRTVCDNYIRLGEQKAEKHYRPFIDTGELIRIWDVKYRYAYGLERINNGLDMPHIWVRRKGDPKDKGRLITAFNDVSVELGEAGGGDVLMMDVLFELFTFLDGSPCGVAK